jgi:hypothetical protein
MSWSPCGEFGNGGAIPASGLRGPFLVSRLPYRVKHVWIVPPWAFAQIVMAITFLPRRFGTSCPRMEDCHER